MWANTWKRPSSALPTESLGKGHCFHVPVPPCGWALPGSWAFLTVQITTWVCISQKRKKCDAFGDKPPNQFVLDHPSPRSSDAGTTPPWSPCCFPVFSNACLLLILSSACSRPFCLLCVVFRCGLLCILS